MKHCSTCVLLWSSHGERTFAGLVHRGSTANIASTVESDVGASAHHHCSIFLSLVEGVCLVCSIVDEPLTDTCAVESLRVNEVSLLRTSLHYYLSGIVRLVLAIDSTYANHVRCGRCHTFLGDNA